MATYNETSEQEPNPPPDEGQELIDNAVDLAIDTQIAAVHRAHELIEDASSAEVVALYEMLSKFLFTYRVCGCDNCAPTSPVPAGDLC